MAIPRLRDYTGPAILCYGFRPFFLLGAAYAGLSILFWIPAYMGHIETFSAFAPVDWHIHEMLFGYLTAIITGFLLTAIPNWTGRLPVLGLPLLVLIVIWIAGRFAVFFSASIGWQVAAVIDAAFLAAVAVAAAREIIAGKNWRNLKVLIPVAILLIANICFHIESHAAGLSDISRRLGMAAAIVLIMIIGGRIIPSFTRNWLVRENPGRLPIPFNRFDGAAIAISAVALASWCFLPDHAGTAAALSLAALFQALRLARWAGDRTFSDPLVLILHIAYAFVPIGLALLSLSIFIPETVPLAAAYHALGGGAIGAMTLSVMTRATLGHTGRDLKADTSTCIIYVAVVLGALTRIIAAFLPAETTLLHVAATSWSGAFLYYALYYGGMLVRPRLKARQPNPSPS
ncbi:NnrS family protein [Pseudaminobacter arsenicus]|uniref:NnrS family protein n=1 Tax=Borborobacter arsenicus TaxID=1851146 RepID=A0A432V1M9_9HYPH|nr:NnrS family protein [Pseudaminobacter arsenicus]RUM96079.1 NnrS family protein [Pseudaminobacter arsenicus]